MNRRQIFLGAAAAAQSVLGQSPRVPTAMIGIGSRGSGLLKGVLEQPNARVAVLCDLKPDKLDAAASAAAKDNPKTEKDWRRVLDNKEVEAVYIATPPYLHAEMAIAALKAGKHVYCEKPIGINPAQVREVLKAARASKKVFTAGQQLRSMGLLKTAVGRIHEGVVGDVAMIKAYRHAGSDLNPSTTTGEWYFDINKSGGYIIEQSVHNLDLCNWVVRSRPARASGFGGIMLHKNDPPGRSIPDCGVISYEYANGVKMSFTQNVFHPRGMPGGGQGIHIFGAKGAVDLMYAVTAYRNGETEPVLLAEKKDESPHVHTTAFFSAVANGGPNPADVTIGATAALSAILGQLAMNRGKTVTWEELGVDV